MAPGSPISPKTLVKSQRVSRQHTLERVRNNQRQHRARRRAYIAILEEKLDEAEETASTLRNQIEGLQAKLAQCHDRNISNCRTIPQQWSQPREDRPLSSHRTSFRVHESLPNLIDPGALSLPVPLHTNSPLSDGLPLGLTFGLELLPECDAASVGGAGIPQTILSLPQPLEDISGRALATVPISTSGSSHESDLAFTTTSYQAVPGTESLLPVTVSSDQLLTHMAPCCSCESSSDPQQRIDALDQMALVRGHGSPRLSPNYVFQPAVEAFFNASVDGESTMLCSEAYVLIAQQNFKGVSQEDVTSWLWNGFRKSLQPGWGCRVKTDLMFSLLAFISEG